MIGRAQGCRVLFYSYLRLSVAPVLAHRVDMHLNIKLGHAPRCGSMDPTYPLLPLANFLAATLTLLTFITTQLRDPWNLGISTLSAWVFINTLFTGIQTIIWRDDSDTSLAPGLCDIGLYIEWLQLCELQR